MTGDLIPAKVLATHTIANVSETLAEKLGLPPQYRSIGIITADSDDVTYCALDEATKKAEVSVAYARSMYAGASNASTALAGEFIGILSGPDPEAVRSGLEAAVCFIQNDAAFVKANDQGTVVYFAHCIARSGSYLSAQAEVPEGTALAYLIAPPLEAVTALDAALKAADVTMRLFYGPPTETNFAGGLLSGTQPACQAACEAFAREVRRVAAAPRVL